jgi:hypothetical protein
LSYVLQDVKREEGTGKKLKSKDSRKKERTDWRLFMEIRIFFLNIVY